MIMESCEEGLSDPREDIRYSTVKAIVESDSIETVPLLLKGVGDSSYRIRKEALKGICAFPSDLIFPRLEEFLRDEENANLRTAAMEAFPRYGHTATPHLLRLLKDRNEDVRMFSATILGDIRDPASVESLIEGLQDPNENVKNACAESLGKIGDIRAVKPLIDCLHQDFWIQYPAVIALGNIGDLAATEHLVKLLNDDMLRQAVVEALGSIGDASAIPVLTRLLAQNDPTIRNDTIASLVNIQRSVKPDGDCLPSIKKALNHDELIGHLIHSLQDPDSGIKKYAIIALGWLKENKAVGYLLELIHDYELEEYVIGALVSIGENSLPEIIDKLNNPDPKIRVSLIRCIEWIGHMDGIRACIPFLKDENCDVRSHAVMAMSEGLGMEEVEDALLELLSDNESEIRDMIVEILGKSGSKKLVEKLIQELSSEDQLRKAAAIQILGHLKNQAACKPLQNLLDDTSDEVRARTYRALGTIQCDQLTKEILSKGVKDKSPMVRQAVAQCFRDVSVKHSDEILRQLIKDTDADVRLDAIKTIGKIGSESCIGDLIESFQDAGPRLRVAIIQAMGHIHHKDSAGFLKNLLKKTDPDLKRMTLESLGMIRDRRSIPDLIVAMDDGDWMVRSGAIQALAQIGDRKCAGRLLKKLNDPDDIVKKEAILALGKLNYKKAVYFILPLIHNENLQTEILNTIRQLGIPDMDSFCKYFKQSHVRLKCRLIDLLSHIKNQGSIEFLVSCLNEEFFTVRCWAARALGNLKDRRAIPYLLKIQKEDPSKEVRKEATHALKRIGSRK